MVLTMGKTANCTKNTIISKASGFKRETQFYLKRTGVAVAQLILTLMLVGMVITVIWVLVDAFLIPGWVRNQNNLLLAQLGA
jgi:hypothetical protein